MSSLTRDLLRTAIGRNHPGDVGRLLALVPARTSRHRLERCRPNGSCCSWSRPSPPGVRIERPQCTCRSASHRSSRWSMSVDRTEGEYSAGLADLREQVADILARADNRGLSTGSAPVRVRVELEKYRYYLAFL